MRSTTEAPDRARNHADATATTQSQAEAPAATFAALGVPAPLVAQLAADGMTEAFPIQQDTLPDTLRGRDVLGRGKTGSGKTLAFALPMIARLGGELASGSRRRRRPAALVLAPTRELANQIDSVIAPLAETYSLRSLTIFGGVKQTRQVAALRAGVDIVVACPGRLEDLMGQDLVSLDAIAITVIDEADHMADLGFLPGVTRILEATPAGGQRMLFSATLDNDVDRLVKRFLNNPMRHSVDEANSPVAAMNHHVFQVDGPDEKKALVKALASGTGRRLLFMRTKHMAKRLAQQLNAAGIPAVDLHGNLSQNARDRNMARFEAGDVKVMVATDVAARGIDVPDVELVVHVDPPTEHKAYLHRSGRTARAGHPGEVVTVGLPEQRDDIADLMRKAGVAVTPVQVTATSPEVVALVGEVAPTVAPKPRADTPHSGSSRRPQRPLRDDVASGPRRRGGQASRAGQASRGGQKSRGDQASHGGQEKKQQGDRRGSAKTSGHKGSGKRAGGRTAVPSSGSHTRQRASLRGKPGHSGGRNH